MNTSATSKASETTTTLSWIESSGSEDVQCLPGSVISIGRESVDDFVAATRREWLVTNGIGGFAFGTVAGARTRRYHGLLVAALNPPVGRTLLVAKVEVDARYLDRTYALSANEYGDGTLAPQGQLLLVSFELEGTLPVWRYALGDALLEQRVFMAYGANTSYLQLRLLRASAPLHLELRPLVSYRDYHAHSQGGWEPGVKPLADGCTVTAFPGARPYRLQTDRGTFHGGGQWHWNFRHRVESERGLDDREDLFQPGCFSVTLEAGEVVTLTATAEPGPVLPASTASAAEQQRQAALLSAAPAGQPMWIRQLLLAADQYLVRRGDGGQTVIAGYPWFTDWGRDTMIALPGLTLATGRYDIAARILTTFASHVSQGMLPNRFPDDGQHAEYNTVDATLWYFQAVASYLHASGDEATVRALYPVLGDIIARHQRGTRYGIHVDPVDGLLYAGEPGVQLTWMDAKVGDWVVTARIGKPVEINALWHNALTIMAGLAARFATPGAVACFSQLAQGVAEQFRQRFWYAEGGYLFDVIDGPEGDWIDQAGRRHDTSLRPNQLLAVSLSPLLLGEAEARSVVDICARRLYTPLGMRSLDYLDPRYVPHYHGGPRERDGAYHQGTVWTWLLGPFVTAHYRVYRDAAAARAWLDGVAAHLFDACLGNISEIADAEPPHSPRGCPAQAWGVAEILRAWLALPQYENPSPMGARTS